jgi:hypothetical protein
MPVDEPFSITQCVPATFANLPHSGKLLPFTKADKKPAQKESPAPVVSIGLMRS